MALVAGGELGCVVEGVHGGRVSQVVLPVGDWALHAAIRGVSAVHRCRAKIMLANTQFAASEVR